MQKIRSLVLAAGLLASIVTGTVVLALTQSTSPALATISTNFQQWHPCSACPTGDI